MSRYENDDLSHLDLPDPIQMNALYLLENGQVVDDEEYQCLLKEQSKTPVICGKQIGNQTTNMETYYILCSGSNMFNPRNKDARYMIRNRWKFRRVTRSTYDLYDKFLRTNHQSFLYQAERGI